MSESSASEPLVNGEPRQQNQRQIVGRQPADILLRKCIPWHACRSQREVTEHGSRSTLIDGHIAHADRELLLIVPFVSPALDVKRCVAALDILHLVRCFETATNEGRSLR